MASESSGSPLAFLSPMLAMLVGVFVAPLTAQQIAPPPKFDAYVARVLTAFAVLGVAVAIVKDGGVGIWFGPAMWGALGTGVAGLPMWHLPTVARFALLLIVTAVAGALFPALRAARTSPARLLSWI